MPASGALWRLPLFVQFFLSVHHEIAVFFRPCITRLFVLLFRSVHDEIASLAGQQYQIDGIFLPATRCSGKMKQVYGGGRSHSCTAGKRATSLHGPPRLFVWVVGSAAATVVCEIMLVDVYQWYLPATDSHVIA